MVEYGYINEDGYLRGRILEEFTRQVPGKNGELVTETVTIEMQIKELTALGWKPVELVDDSKLEPKNEFSSVHIKPVDLGERIGYEYIESFNNNLLKQRIDKLKDELTASDYKITKSYEASLLKLAIPYDVAALHTERQAIRNEINRLELLYQ